MFACTLWIALIVYSLSVVGAVLAPRQTAGEVPVANSVSPSTSLGRHSLLGFALTLHHTDQFHLYTQAIDEMAALGFNCLQLVTPAFQTDGASDRVFIETGPGRGPTRAQLVALLRHARQRGMTTALMPQVLLTHPRGNEWRGKINPEHWDPWWRSYEQMIDYFLGVANETGVDIFCVGSELLSTERQNQRWAQLIARVRSRFPGALTYSTNWDHFHVPTIWRDLDMIGISGYWDLTEDAQHDPPTPGDLAHRWERIRDRLLAFAQTFHKPMLFTEVGYPSLPWALQDPWNYINSDDTPTDHAVQAEGYRAFLSAWGDLLTTQHSRSTFAGVFFYAWDPYHRGGDRDTGYGVRGKPALNVIKQWLERN